MMEEQISSAEDDNLYLSKQLSKPLATDADILAPKKNNTQLKTIPILNPFSLPA